MDISKQVVLVWALLVLTLLALLAIITRTVSTKKHCPSSNDTSSNLQSADPNSSSTSSSSPLTWDVFLSFHGKDTRNNFTSHLYSALDQAGIRTFKDDHALEKGQEISPTLLDAIRNSNMFIVVLSENYARSRWCLDELAEILECDRTKNQVVPVFYYVDPSDVRHQKGSFGKTLDCHKKRHSSDMIVKWTSALYEIAKLTGYHLRKEANEDEADIIQKIVGNVATREFAARSQHEIFFGIDSAVEEIYQRLRMDSDDVRAIGICGMGGIGKTTIAKTFYHKNVNKFKVSCFSENVEQYSHGVSPLLPPLEQLLVDLLRKKNYKVIDVESKIRKLKQILHSKKALIVLDDLDQSNYSELLASLGNFFSAGSKIIITTRDANLLNKLKAEISEFDTYMVKTLGQIESMELFSYHAFRKPVPPESFKELSLSFVTHAGGLPLALKVLGSSLLGRSHESFWKDKLEKVKAIPENDIQKILQLSYDGLEDETQKAIFLDIAFFFIGKDKDEATDVFKSCDFFPRVGIPNLVDRCLLTIDNYNRFQMHNLIRDMGRELGKTTRLFLRGNAWKDLQNVEGRNDIEGLVLDLTTSMHGQMTTFLFERMTNLRLLQIIGAPNIKGNFKNLFPNLRCIRWHFCPWTHIPLTFHPPKLVSIDMPSSQFKILWKGPVPIDYLNYLSCLYLSRCHDLKRLPEQLGDMKALKKIDASFTAIEKLPDSVIRLKELAELNLRYCEKFRELPGQLGKLKGLKKLDARSTVIKQLPDSITHLKELGELKLRYCSKLTELPEQLGEMWGLRDLDAGYSAIKQLPDSITKLKGLVTLELDGCENLRKLPEEIGNIEGLKSFKACDSAIEQLPDSFEGLINLVTLRLSSCKNLRNLPNSICKLKLLQELYVNKCPNLEQLPEQLGKMQCLEMLDASETAIEQVPDSIGLLSRLLSLTLKDCKKLKFVSKSIWNLTSTQAIGLYLGKTGEISLPDSVRYMKNLIRLELSCNVRLCLPMIQCFSSLERLVLTDEGQILSTEKPFSLSKLFNLRVLELYNCTSFGSSLPELPLNLEELRIYNHTSLEQLPDLSSLRNLKLLYMYRCISLQSISLLPSHLLSLSVRESSILQDLPDLSVLKELEGLWLSQCNNLKSVSLKPSSFPHHAHLPNREVAEWFNYKSSGHTVSFDVPPSFGSNFLGLALWVVFTCKSCKGNRWTPYMKAVVTNETEGVTENYRIEVRTVVGEVQSRVQCITGEKLSVKSGDRIKVSFPSLLYKEEGKEVVREEVKEGKEVVRGEVKVNMCGVHVIQ